MDPKQRWAPRKPQVVALDVAGRVPPHDNDAERAVLSAVLTEERSFDLVVDVWKSGEECYTDAHRRIWGAAVELKRRGQPVDIQTVATYLKDRDQLQAIGGLVYLANLVDATPAVAHVVAHAQIVKDKYRVRRLIETCQMVAAEGYTDYGNAKTYIDSAEQRVYELARDAETSGQAEVLYDIIKRTFETIAEAAERGDTITGISTGFRDLDEMTSGMHNGELIIVAGRPGMGKTAYVLNMATNVATPVMEQSGDEELRPRENFGVMIFSLEMPKDQLSHRMICSESRIDLNKLRKMKVFGADWDHMVEGASRLSQLPVFIDDTPALSLLEMRSRVRRKQAEFNRKDESGRFTQRIGLVIVDYLQLMADPPSAQNREQAVSENSRGLKGLAKELGLPVIALSQLNRAVETRGKDKRPILSDLRESGAVEQDADVIQFVYRPEYYITDKNSAEAEKLKGYAEILIAKQRNGPTGKVKLTFRDFCARFENRDPSAYMGDDD